MPAARGRLVVETLLGHAARGLLEARLGFGGKHRLGRSLARHARLACEELGPGFMKLGQLLSVRPDVVPPEFVFELERLRDRAAPLSFDVVRDVLRAEFAADPGELFDDFEESPVASASIAQVHRARLRRGARPVWGEALAAGTPVAVKVLRPGAEGAVEADLRLLEPWLARFHRWGLLGRISPKSFLREMSRAFDEECDLSREGRLADRFRFNFRREPGVLIPRVVWERTTRRVLTTEFVEGWGLDRLDDARRAGVDPGEIGLRGTGYFMSQVLVHGLYHADLHHANLLITTDGRIAYLDFGLVGTLSAEDRIHVAGVLAALTRRDPGAALRHAGRLGLVIPPGKEPALRRHVEALAERTLTDAPGHKPDVKGFALGLFRLLRRHDAVIPEGFALLLKSLVTVEGVSRSLRPDVDILSEARLWVATLLLRKWTGLPRN